MDVTLNDTSGRHLYKSIADFDFVADLLGSPLDYPG